MYRVFSSSLTPFVFLRALEMRFYCQLSADEWLVGNFFELPSSKSSNKMDMIIRGTTCLSIIHIINQHRYDRHEKKNARYCMHWIAFRDRNLSSHKPIKYKQYRGQHRYTAKGR